MELVKKQCVPCEGGTKPLDEKEIVRLLKETPGWQYIDGHLRRQLRFKNFMENMRFISRMADLAEEEGHHPDFCVHYAVLDLELYTHAINGLSENDFIMAAKINKLLS